MKNLITIFSFIFALFSNVNLQAQAGEALNFDGSNDYVNVPFSNELVFSTTGTWEGWFRFENISPNQGLFNMNNNTYWDSGYYIVIVNGSIIYTEAHGTGTLLYQAASQTNVLSVNQWHHVAIVKDGANVSIYVDGVESPIVSNGPYGAPIASLTATTGNLVLGAVSGVSAGSLIQYLDGDRDEVRLWNIARSQAEIQATMNTELAGNEAGLVAYYQFNEGIAGANNAGVTNLPDLSGNSNDGSLLGFSLNPGNVSNWIAENPGLAPPTPLIPTMGEWSLIIFALMVASMGIISVMRWQRESKSRRAIA